MHVIRLRKPWSKTIGDRDTVRRVEIPEPSGLELEAVGVVARYDRSFNRPSRLDDARVYLRIAGWQGKLNSLSLNEIMIPVGESSTQVDVEITSLLQAHNQLSVTIAGTAIQPPRLSGEVTLGIEETLIK